MGGCHDRRNPTGGSQGKYTWTSINAAVVVGHGGVRASSCRFTLGIMFGTQGR